MEILSAKTKRTEICPKIYCGILFMASLVLSYCATAQQTDSAALRLQKISKGIDFYGWGHEPDWTLDLDLESGAQFTSKNGISFSADSLESTITTEDKVSRYRRMTEKGEMIITIYGYGCTDSKSGRIYSHKVRVGIKKTDDTKYSIFEGCGYYLNQ